MINHAKQAKSQDQYDHVVLRYSNRKLYLTEQGLYISYGDLIEYIKNNESFVIYEDRTGVDITDIILRSLLARIVRDEELVSVNETVDLLMKFLLVKSAKV